MDRKPGAPVGSSAALRLLRKLAGMLGCRLCWRVTLAVFVLILVVESALLVPSAQRFERVELERLADQAVVAVEPALLLGGAAPRDLAALAGQYRVAGLALFDRSGEPLLRVGEHHGLRYTNSLAGAASVMAVRLGRSADGRRTDVAWRSGSAGEPLVIARLDSSHLAAELRGYLARIGGVVLVIVLVVTAGTMLVLHFAVLRPLLALRASSRAAGAEPGRAEAFQLGSRREDEMGEVLRAHDEMLRGVADSKRRDREVAEERARHISHHDSLSGLPNRAALMEYLERCRGAGGEDLHAALFLVNLREFREFNAGAGARRGDALLRQLAAALQRSAAPGDFVAHIGADRFAVVRLRAAAAGDAAYAEVLVRAARDACDAAAADAPRVRVGVSAAAAAVLDGPALLAQAEFALSRTGAEDSGEYQFYSPALAGEARERQELTRALQSAIREGELFLAYQPKVALGGAPGARVAGAEALLRWNRAGAGAVSPARFIPLAEATGLIVPLGELVLEAATRQMRQWLDRHGWSPRVAVNLSAQQFSLPDLAGRLQAALAARQLDARLLEVEVTETAAMRDVARTAATLETLRSLGVRVSIDDFGSGYSSLLYLHRFAVDAIKIDRSFVESIGIDAQGEAICDAVLRLGQALGTRVIAEGVETEAQLEFLRRRRCHEVQGYLIGRPVSAPEFERSWIAERAAA